MPGISKDSCLDLLHKTSKDILQVNEHVKVETEAVVRLGQELSNPERMAEVRATAASRSLSFPIKFENLESEVNFMALYYLLSFGSGWDKELLARSRRDSAETIQFGLIGMHISGHRLDHHFMKAFSALEVHNYFGIESHVDHELESLPGVTISKPGPLHPLVTSIQSIINETGQALSQEGCSSLGQLILNLAAKSTEGRSQTASAIVEELSSTIPGFQDCGLYEGRQVHFNRKAQALVFALSRRFSGEDARFAFPDMDKITADTGPALAATLRAKGILRYSSELSEMVDSGHALTPGPQERSIRSASIAATDMVLEAMMSASSTGDVTSTVGTFNAHELSLYLSVLIEEGQELHKAPFSGKHITKCLAY
ncbi:hypothetical protein CEUSTIGMA_g10217.t1 [Chlamydomonas eustigma]|uniref:Queuosine 5'-phosphate N-glycosylase/hydrolase n=1 Tax=Chlamydomonas eustigma TaxID=1157962 RepID=A0A250XI84_9CHLO|nr:hypothetical protein CEUSTIGMA_g10217.t1 [Chlamydomonas eustigma]|eukprot:GAX82791.1 hypothetical protein CEUSTIGMA_g10217.t1 [Chlamydomonas eustigma]